MPPAARITDLHVCPHVGGPVASGAANVLIGHQPAARVGDKAACVCAPGVDAITKGEPTVIIEGKDAARLGDPTEHGGKMVAGCPTVLIGAQTYKECLKKAAESATPFVTGHE
jgi:uncharacterized Zn-binding protein involved in type VI secretion